VAQEIGKPVANTYKAVQSLFKKGAIMIDETENRLCQAVDPEIFLENLKKTYLTEQASAKEALSKLSRSTDSERIYSLSTPEQVFDRCRQMCFEAESIILIDAFPGVTEKLKPWVEEAGTRGVKVLMQAYEALEMDGVEIVPVPSAEMMTERWKGHWLIVVVDGAEYLQAFLGSDLKTVQVANWCGSAFLAIPQHNFLANTFRQAGLESQIEKGKSAAALKVELKRTEAWTTMGNRGYEKLRERFGG
jgi:sugar-specific transcriptional regulator TrmB